MNRREGLTVDTVGFRRSGAFVGCSLKKVAEFAVGDSSGRPEVFGRRTPFGGCILRFSLRLQPLARWALKFAPGREKNLFSAWLNRLIALQRFPGFAA